MVAKGGHPAAEACRARGEQWYLPARDEAALFANKGSMIGGFSQSDYWTATKSSDGTAGGVSFSTAIYYAPPNGGSNVPVIAPNGVRCVRR